MSQIVGQTRNSLFLTTLTACLASAALMGCGGGERSGDGDGSSSSSGAATSLRIDGSSTVYPISEAAAEIFSESHEGARISVSASGTSAGMNKFLLGEIDICDASRPIKDSEKEKAKEAGLEYIEFVVGLDGLAVVVNPENDWCTSMTVEQLRAIWRPEADATITSWNQVDESWPDEPLKLFGPGTASGTFEYFTEEIVGEKNSSRSDYQKSEDDNMLVAGVSGTKGGLGYFGYAYYAENKDKLKLVGVDSGSGPIEPSESTVKDGSYSPLSRPLFIYVSKKSLSNPGVAEFVRYYVENAATLAEGAQYVAASAEAQAKNAELLKEVK
ncbi:MAG: PstS family phosphate ABC transporter substrate-binding protein [Planctomycetales bacterium]|nr:PstS family phosphate ABC transporter substrate-binding protein [Planctomycetales bacterium]